ncbi:flagellar biosynthesis protein [Peptoclostridium litorale DSM 5388]|uniref:Flagellar biosynthetic protein FlhB n=1 Tax=Peptoclostridium litorale DSM 5388 TaxID=1121324 RepID=A0A069RAW6_PEPLI|nr:EscU/YscU/HrcU family type III secretion system export apparatus switch protein [Peptoclostridium litorale]KDR94166.1 hypothetical protein CLIT_23c04390 [Peptoclostridium litorale DSM 5388]SIN81739.1 flagellar biosynthesis protein [Peptoclostridium litorale DSM 5388]
MNVKRGIKIATAIKYDMDKDSAPRLVAKGVGIVAENIIKKAQENNIKVLEDESISQSLMQLEVESEIPEVMYDAVAKILAFIYEMDRDKKGR